MVEKHVSCFGDFRFDSRPQVHLPWRNFYGSPQIFLKYLRKRFKVRHNHPVFYSYLFWGPFALVSLHCVNVAVFVDFSEVYIAPIFRAGLRNMIVHIFISFGPKDMVPIALKRVVLVIFPCPTSLWHELGTNPTLLPVGLLDQHFYIYMNTLSTYADPEDRNFM